MVPVTVELPELNVPEVLLKRVASTGIVAEQVLSCL